MDFPKIVSIADKFLNPTDAEQFRNMVYQLQQENIDLKTKYHECFTKLKEFEDWEVTKKKYKEYKTGRGGIVQALAKESTPDVFYCPVCFSKKSIVPLQKITQDLAKMKFDYLDSFMAHQFCPSNSCNAVFPV